MHGTPWSPPSIAGVPPPLAGADFFLLAAKYVYSIQ